MTKPSFTENAFKTEEEAAAIAKREGFPITVALDLPAEENAFHYHDFESLVFVASGELAVTYRDSGETVVFKAGTIIRGTPGVVHKEKTAGYRAMFGLKQDPATLTQPINKPAA